MHVLGEGWRLIRREYPTPIGPVDLMCKDADGTSVAVEIKRRGEIDGVEQLTRYLDLLNRDPRLAPVQGIFAAQEIKPQARVLATDLASAASPSTTRRCAAPTTTHSACSDWPAAAGAEPTGHSRQAGCLYGPIRALITNDDGIDSAGLRTLAQVAVAAGQPRCANPAPWTCPPWADGAGLRTAPLPPPARRRPAPG